MSNEPFADIRDKRIGDLNEEQVDRSFEFWARENINYQRPGTREALLHIFNVIDRLRAALAQAEAAQPAPEWLPVVRAVHQQFRLYSERMPDGFDSRVFRWVADLLAAVEPSEAAQPQQPVPEPVPEPVARVSLTPGDDNTEGRV